MSKGDHKDKSAAAEPAEEWRRAVRVAAQNPPPQMCDHTAVWFERQDQKRFLLLFGGYHQSSHAPSNQFFEYEFDTKTWTAPKTATPLAPAPRYHHTAVALGREMIVFGGFDGNGVVGDTWALKLEPAYEWRKLQPEGQVPSARRNHSAARLPQQNKFLIFGGFDGEERLNDLYEFCLDTAKWRKVEFTGLPPCPRDGHGMALLGQNSLYVFGGYGHAKLNDLFVFQIDTQLWCKVPPAEGVPSVRFGHSCVAYQDALYVFHGFDGARHLAEVYEYEPALRKWTKVDFQGELLEPKCFHTTTLIEPEKRVVCFGGWDGTNNLCTLWDYEFGEQVEKEQKKKKEK
eukprot:TRINITY_DN33850_c0_g1_i1.p1 TRINITY_DN33850_c0_g1~~TRINITY_DN33850_c0_g1_i1.p1  ORF type:complete len:344 (-),score=70.58 TRINITY_DN33850_c0_g1_i1:10-1041(-)